MAKCDCYFQHGTKFLCYGTKEREECSCGGDESKCNFYPEKRKQKMANEKLLSQLSTIERMLGKIEGVAFVLEDKYATPLFDAIEVIDVVMGEIKDGK